MQRKLMGLLLLVATSAFAQNSAPLGEDDPAVWEARAARAKSLRDESKALRSAADAQQVQDDIACRKRFFENACKDAARERWIEKINKVRALEIEAVGLERNQRAHEIAMKEKALAANPPRPPLILPQVSAPAEMTDTPQKAAAPTATSPTGATAKPKAAAKPVDKTKQAEHEAQRQRDRDEQAAQAAARAEQARKDAARYDARAAEHARKEAEKKAKQGTAAPAAQSGPAK
jgi:colicin import membrane protein